MKNVIQILLYLILLILFSCEEFELVTCDNCLYEEPSVAILNISLDEGLSFGYVHTIVIYKGKIEDGIVIDTFETQYSRNIEVSLNTEYTVTASVTINGNTYVSTDSAIPRTKTYYGCDELCYYVVDDKVNLNLKYY
ncbi:MAG TPA: hypothetical protein VMW76_08705 [Bacteroidales bacterium]|nr:hypothetical protein [Bacteroidales bacterium]